MTAFVSEMQFSKDTKSTARLYYEGEQPTEKSTLQHSAELRVLEGSMAYLCLHKQQTLYDDQRTAYVVDAPEYLFLTEGEKYQLPAFVPFSITGRLFCDIEVFFAEQENF